MTSGPLSATSYISVAVIGIAPGHNEGVRLVTLTELAQAALRLACRLRDHILRV